MGTAPSGRADADLDVARPREDPQVAGEAGREAHEHRRVAVREPAAGHEQPSRGRRAEERPADEAARAVRADDHVVALPLARRGAHAALGVDLHHALGAVACASVDRPPQQPRVELAAGSDEDGLVEAHVDGRPLA